MSENREIVIINKEKIFKDNNHFYCDNIDMKSIPEGLVKNSKVSIIAVKSKIKRFHKIGLENIKITSNIIQLFFNIIKTFKNKETKYLLISVTPYSFFAFLLLLIFKKNISLYLRSNGYEEYKAILGFFGPFIYHIMYTVITSKSKIITCQKRLVKKKNYNLVFPSELDKNWLKGNVGPPMDKPRLLYVGRLKIEKGIFSLIKILDEINYNYNLSIVGEGEKVNVSNKKIIFFGFENNISSLIKIYDDHNITVLPSFTEAHPKVVDESLARVRPVIIFEEINYIIQNRYGIFVAKRNAKSLIETIQFIMKNYSSIQVDIKKNKLPTKQKFISQMAEILN